MIRSLLKFMKGCCTQNRVLRSAALILLAAVILTVAGCYETDFEVITASSAVAVYGVPGNYTLDEGGTLTISAVPHSNDYRFREVTKNKASTGYLRAIPLRGDIYIVQAKYDDESVYYLEFYQFTNDRRFRPLSPDVKGKRLEQLAQQYGVKIGWDDMFFGPDYLSGSRSNIMAFLRAHANLPFTSGE